MGGAAVAWVIYALLRSPSGRKYGRVGITFWQSFFGLLGCLPFALAESSSWRGVGLPVALNVLYLGVFCSAVGYWLYVSAMDRLGAGTTSVFLNLVPVVSVGAAFLLLGERLDRPVSRGERSPSGASTWRPRRARRGREEPRAREAPERPRSKERRERRLEGRRAGVAEIVAQGLHEVPASRSDR